MNPYPNMSQPTSSTFKVGDRVTVDIPGGSFVGRLGTLIADDLGAPTKLFPCAVKFDDTNVIACRASELQHPAEALVKLAEQLGAVEHNSWTADGLLCRRYITADGSIDLTVRVP